MMELLKNAWSGWLDFTTGGKIVALLLIVLLIYWFARNEWKTYFGSLATYTTLMVVCCICPLTAALLMGYQTRFYDYQWIWNLVPITIVVALGGTLLWTELVEKCGKQKGYRWRIIALTLALVGIVCISGGMGNTQWEPEEEAAKRRETVQVLETLQEYVEGTAAEDAADTAEADGAVMLWAPQSIMEYARGVDGSILLPYGRNMWDISLNAYTYDVYGVPEEDLYAWMCNAEIYGTGEVEREVEVMRMESDSDMYSSVAAEMTETTMQYTLTATECIDLAGELGVTHILLPENMQPQVVEELEDYLDEKAEILEGYYLFCL